MTSAGSPLHNFLLTPQQQNLLYAALNSNKQASNSPPNNALTMSPSSFSGSPLQKTEANTFQDSPFQDYDYSFDNADSSLDFSFDNDGQAKMIGDLPGDSSPAKEGSSSPENESPDKRSHPDDEEGGEENGAKRRESTEKVPKKPGRKPLTSEPTSKRKAQNRAAQRAFRERKERHLKDLEDKLMEVEKASAATNDENRGLRAQVDKLTVQLGEYKKRLSLVSSYRAPMGSASNGIFGNPILGNINDVNFQFEFPKFGQAPPMRSNSAGSALANSPTAKGQTSTLAKAKDNASPASSGYSTALDMQTKDDLAKFSGLFSPPLTNNNVASASRSSMDSHFSVGGGTSTSSPSASSNSNMGGPSSSCGTSPEPFTQSPMGFKAVDTLTTIGEEQPTLATDKQEFNQMANVDINELGWLPSQNDFQFDPQLFGDYREPQDNVLASGGFDDSFFNDALDMDFTTPFNVAPSPIVQKSSLIAQIDAAKEGDTDAVANPGQLLTCNKIWEKLQSCPRVQNGDFDLDGLCSDLQKKAKCSGSGAVVNEQDFTHVMKKYLCKGETEAESEECKEALKMGVSLMKS